MGAPFIYACATYDNNFSASSIPVGDKTQHSLEYSISFSLWSLLRMLRNDVLFLYSVAFKSSISLCPFFAYNRQSTLSFVAILGLRILRLFPTFQINEVSLFIIESIISVVSSNVKYSLQGTTQSRYLTGGVPPVRFSM